MRRKAVTVRQIQTLDRVAIDQYGVPSLSLMENAGRAVANEIIGRLKKADKAHVCIICGLGNNAGDGFVIARHLINAKIKTTIFLIGQGKKLKADAAVNYKILKRLKYPIREIRKADSSFLRAISRSDIIVDAIFGVGLNREVLDPFRGIIDAVNKKARVVVSVDVPSGLDGTTGKIHGVCIRADVTVTFSFIKKGFLKGEGPKHTGKVVVVDIGIPLRLKNRIG